MTDERKQIHFPDCYLEDNEGQKYDRTNVCNCFGAPMFAVATGAYPKGTRFDVTLTFIAKPPKEKSK
jgi:hypothetical protein